MAVFFFADLAAPPHAPHESEPAGHLLRKAKSKPSLDIYLTDLSEQAESMAKRFLGTDFGKVKKATL